MTQELAEYAATVKRPRKNQCFVCRIPERAEVERGRAAKVKLPVIVAWLRDECGYDESELAPERIRKHFKDNHHTREAA